MWLVMLVADKVRCMCRPDLNLANMSHWPNAGLSFANHLHCIGPLIIQLNIMIEYYVFTGIGSVIRLYHQTISTFGAKIFSLTLSNSGIVNPIDPSAKIRGLPMVFNCVSPDFQYNRVWFTLIVVYEFLWSILHYFLWHFTHTIF